LGRLRYLPNVPGRTRAWLVSVVTAKLKTTTKGKLMNEIFSEMDKVVDTFFTAIEKMRVED
jgi:hypothetical protein